ncbi:MAG: tetratricopeptide repeat protein [Desulfobacterales bacterium]|nr:tetratricopeptide repeat protein [Desulfobacterales bacterium]
MRRTYINPQVLLIIGVVLLAGCTSYMKGFMNMERDNYEAAIEHFQQELSKNPTNWRARQNLGLAYIRTGQNDKAIAELQYVLGQEPADVTALSYAPQGVEWATGQNPNASYPNYYLGLAYLRNGQREEALETWKAYKNPREPLLEEEIQRQYTVVEISNSVHLARLALEQEKKLETLPPKAGTVAVFYFKDVSPDNSFRHFQKAMAEMIITDLAQIKSLTVLERMRVQYLLTEMQMGQTGIVDQGTAPRAGRLLGAENLIVGSLEPGSISVNTTIASATKSDVVGAFAVTAEQEEFFELEKEIVFNVVKILGVSLSPQEEQRMNQYHTKNLQAVLFLGQGLDALDDGQWKDARVFFRKALDEDPGFKIARYYLEHCPAATTATIGAISAMTVGQLAADVESAVSTAAGDQAAISVDNDIGGQGGLLGLGSGTPASSGAPGPSTGSVGISW